MRSNKSRVRPIRSALSGMSRGGSTSTVGFGLRLHASSESNCLSSWRTLEKYSSSLFAIVCSQTGTHLPSLLVNVVEDTSIVLQTTYLSLNFLRADPRETASQTASMGRSPPEPALRSESMRFPSRCPQALTRGTGCEYRCVPPPVDRPRCRCESRVVPRRGYRSRRFRRRLVSEAGTHTGVRQAGDDREVVSERADRLKVRRRADSRNRNPSG